MQAIAREAGGPADGTFSPPREDRIQRRAPTYVTYRRSPVGGLDPRAHPPLVSPPTTSWVKRARASKPAATTSGTSICSMAPQILRTAIPCSASRSPSSIEARRIAGTIYDPTRDEMFTAEKGSGAHLNGEPMHVSSTAKLAESLVATGFPSHKRHKNPNIYFYHQPHIALTWRAPSRFCRA